MPADRTVLRSGDVAAASRAEALGGYRPEIDGLRAVAVYLVLLFHAGVGSFTGGFVGVDLFFVLSGFLVAQVVLREVDHRGRLPLGWFYSRRVRRLLPAAIVVVVLTAALQVLVTSLPLREEMVDDARASLLYYANWHFIAESRDYFAGQDAASPFLHFWSLSIEEQFYIGFPLLVLAAHRWSRRPGQTLAVAVGAICLASVGAQVWRAGADPGYAYYATEARVYQLAVGVLLALGTRALVARGRTPGARARWAAPVGLVALVVVGSGLVDPSPSVRGLLAASASTVAIAGLWAAPYAGTARLLALPLPRYLGQVSYGTYLWHWPVLLALRDVLDVRPVVLAAVGGVLATGLAALSYQVLERPIRRARVLDAPRWTVVASALALSGVVAVLVVPTVLGTDRKPALTASAAERGGPALHGGRLDQPLPAGLDLGAAKADVPPLVDPCTVDDPASCTVVRGDGAHVLLVGDSQAQMFVAAFEQLARDHDLTLSVAVVPACMWQAGLQNELSTGEEQAACRSAREDFYRDVLPVLHPDTVVAISMAHSSSRWEEDLTAPGGPAGETLQERLRRTTQETAETIRAAGADLVLVKSLLGTEGFDTGGFDPIDCLARADRLGDCAVVPPLERPALDGVYDDLALTDPGIAAVDVNPVICVGTPACLPVVGDRVVWKDRDHVTAGFLVDRRDLLWQRLAGTGYLG